MSDMELSKTKEKRIIKALDKLKYEPASTGAYETMRIVNGILTAHFVEQACEVIDAIEEGLQPLIGNYHNGISKAEAKQAIRDKFK